MLGKLTLVNDRDAGVKAEPRIIDCSTERAPSVRASLVKTADAAAGQRWLFVAIICIAIFGL